MGVTHIRAVIARMVLETPFRCGLELVSDGDAITDSRFVAKNKRSAPGERDSVLQEAELQVAAYFRHRLKRFDLPYSVEGTGFQRAVWQTVALLETGELVSYSDVARAIGRPFAQRAVAMTMGKTPLAILIPAHRVVGADGRVKGAPPNSLRRRLLIFEGFRLRRDGTLRYEVRS